MQTVKWIEMVRLGPTTATERSDTFDDEKVSNVSEPLALLAHARCTPAKHLLVKYINLIAAIQCHCIYVEVGITSTTNHL